MMGSAAAVERKLNESQVRHGSLTSGYTGSTSSVRDSDIYGNDGAGIYFVVSEYLSTSYFPTGHYNSIYENETDSLGDGSNIPLRDVDWTNNYFGDDVEWRDNPDECLHDGRLAYWWDLTQLPNGPITAVFYYVTPEPNNVIWCGFDEYTITEEEFSTTPVDEP